MDKEGKTITDRFTYNKRFNYIPFDGFNDNGKELSAYDVLEILNELHDENDQLKKELNAFKPVMFKDMRKGTVILYRKGDDQ